MDTRDPRWTPKACKERALELLRLMEPIIDELTDLGLDNVPLEGAIANAFDQVKEWPETEE